MNKLRKLGLIMLIPIFALLLTAGIVWIFRNFDMIDIISYIISVFTLMGIIFFMLSFLIKKDDAVHAKEESK